VGALFSSVPTFLRPRFPKGKTLCSYTKEKADLGHEAGSKTTAGGATLHSPVFC
jgi:hypothetical protein